MKRNLLLIAFSLLVCAAVTAFAQGRRGPAQSFDATATKDALQMALTGDAGEYAALALYTAVTEKIGEVQPFVNIREAEKRHVQALQTQWVKLFGNTVPPNELVRIFDGTTVKEAALAGRDAERLNIAMYTVLLAPLDQNRDFYPASVVNVFNNLQSASADNHLAAFLAILAGDGTATGATCPQSGLKKGQRAGLCQGNGNGQQVQGACQENCQLNCADCPNAGTGCQRQQRARGK